MNLQLPGDDDPRRQEVRSWLAEHPEPGARQLAEAGYVAPHWPPPFGRGADAVTQLLIDEELDRANVRRPFNPIGLGWAGPTLLAAGTPEQKERWLWPLLSGEEVWCQLFSEPEAGSDLASLRTVAEAVRGGWVVRGQKVWTSYAHLAQVGILLARSDSQAPAHHGLTYFICPMDAPGVTVRPLVDMTGAHSFNEVILDEVFVADDLVVGGVGQGWELARVTLANERVSLSTGGALWGMGPSASDLVELVRRAGGLADPVLRQRLARLFAEGEILRALRWRMVAQALAGRAPGPEASVRKALGDAHGQRLMELGRDLAGPYGAVVGTSPTARAPSATDDGRPWAYGFLFAAALTIGGGTAEVQRNIIGERLLGLPREPAAGA